MTVDTRQSSHTPPSGYAVTEDADRQTKQQALDSSQKTTGEKWYRWTALTINFIGTFISSALIAFGVLENKWYNENVTQKMEKWKFFGKELGEDGAKNLNNTFWLMQGGNIMLIPMHFMEKSKKEIVQYFNKKFGKADEVEIYEERHKEVPKISWGDFIKGRIVAFLTVWGGFTIAERYKKEEMGKFVVKTGEKFSDLLKKDPYLLNTSGDRELDKDNNPIPTTTNKIGRMFALDAFATAVAVLILDIGASFFSKKKHPAAEETPAASQPEKKMRQQVPTPSVAGQPIALEKQAEVEKSIREKLEARKESYTAEREKEKSTAPAEAAALMA